ncbi:MAG: class I SAM-dependent methyltransferase [Rhodobacter sp.]|nr:class I SAM-dependent methyltransferase [Rhodobacter sp.]MBK8439715.1 class I SAM-dependent methyltransferase [Rhodobacter sp.]
MDVVTTTMGQTDLPRYFAAVFDVASGLAEGRLDFVLPDGRRFRCGGHRPGEVAEIGVRNPDFFARLIREGELGFCEAYLDGWWDTPDLQALLDLLQRPANTPVNHGYAGHRLVRAWERLRFWLQGNSKRQARRNIAAHYDLGNDFYRFWLDDSMTYSSAIFESPQDSLEAAQERKYASMVDRIGAQPGDHVLEIGCGWGGFAEYAAGKRGLRVTALTISRAQHDYAVKRMARAGLSDRVDIRLQDYRDETGRYDGIASIEMFEAVGEKYWPTYFRTVHDRLKPGRKAVLQVITIAEARWERYRRNVDFIQRFVFPGGMLPTASRLREEGGRVGLAVQGAITFGESYSLTLRRWREVFSHQWEDIRRLGFDERFRRMWDLYLASCAGAFHGGNCDVTQITLSRPER